MFHHSNIAFFADDTRISKQVSGQEHCLQLQEDLNAVMSWSQENNMELHRDKFELIIHKAKVEPYPDELPFYMDPYSYNVSDDRVQ